jgi:hypothetical protein
MEEAAGSKPPPFPRQPNLRKERDVTEMIKQQVSSVNKLITALIFELLATMPPWGVLAMLAAAVVIIGAVTLGLV